MTGELLAWLKLSAKSPLKSWSESSGPAAALLRPAGGAARVHPPSMAVEKSAREPGRGLGTVALFAPIAVYGVVLAHYAVDVPRSDDFFSILPFLSGWISAAGPKARLGLLFAQYFSHRIVFTRCLALLDYRLFGYCNLIALQCFGWAAWAALCLSLALTVPAVRRRPILGLPVSLLLMQPQGWTNLTIAMQAVQNLGVVLFAFWALRTASDGRVRALAASLALGLLATLASVNGVLVFPVAVIGLAADRRYRPALVYAAAGAIVATGYFRHYSLGMEPFHAVEWAANAAAMFGGLAVLGRLDLGAALIGGALLLAASLAAVAIPTWRRMLPSHVLFLLFLLLSVAMAARGRIGWGVDYMLQDRYRLYGLLAAAVLYLIAVAGDRVGPRPAAAAIIAAGLFCLLSYATYLAPLADSARWCLATAMNWQWGRAYLQTTAGGWSPCEHNFERAIAQGLIRLPRPLSAEGMRKIDALDRGGPSPGPFLRATPNGSVCGRLLAASGNDALSPPDFGLLRRPGAPLIVAVSRPRARLVDIPRLQSLFSPRFAFILPDAIYRQGRFPISGLLLYADGRVRLEWSGTALCP